MKPQTKFTRQPEVRAVLDKYEECDETGAPKEPDEGDIVGWDGLTVDDAIRLMEFLPLWQMDQRQNASPSIREMIQLGLRYPAIQYFGYRVPPEREDERISFEGFRVPKEGIFYEAEELRERLKPDLDQDDFDQASSWCFWWD